MIYLQLPGDKILGLAKFFLGIGIPGSAEDLYYQIDALSYLENIRQEFRMLYFQITSCALLFDILRFSLPVINHIFFFLKSL